MVQHVTDIKLVQFACGGMFSVHSVTAYWLCLAAHCLCVHGGRTACMRSADACARVQQQIY
jgi:hypothetical protein